ncbi:hypothetical protein FRX31_025555, partial [Thalictrum thalictroides]
MEKDRDVIGTDSGSSVPVEENSGGLPPGEEKKNKNICPIETCVKKEQDGDDEIQNIAHQKLCNGPRLSMQKNTKVGSLSVETKGKASNAMKTSANVRVPHSNANFVETSKMLPEWKNLPLSNNLETRIEENIQKFTTETGLSSDPIPQLVGQRPHKRTEDLSSIPNDGEAPISFEGFTTPDTSTGLSSSGVNGTLASTQQFRMNSKNGLSSAITSDTSSQAYENKLKRKKIHIGSEEDRAVDAVLESEETGYGVHKNGQNCLDISLSRESTPSRREKVDIPPATNLIQSEELNKRSRKENHSSIKELPDYNAYNIPGFAFDRRSSDRTVAALACSDSVWRRIEPIFASISSDDIAFLDQQLNSAEEGDPEVLDFGSEHDDPDEEETLDERRFENVIPLSQILFSAMIEEDGIEESNFDDEKNDGTSAIVHDPSGESIYASEEPYDGDILKSETGKTAMVPSQGCSDISLDDSQYQNMSFEERCSVELESVGIDYKPCVDGNDEDEISNDISKLRKKLRHL